MKGHQTWQLPCSGNLITVSVFDHVPRCMMIGMLTPELNKS